MGVGWVAAAVAVGGACSSSVPPVFEGRYDDCSLAARRRGDELLFAEQTCEAREHERVEAQGKAWVDDDGVLQLELDSGYWLPNEELWPKGLWWDCGHEYSLDRIDRPRRVPPCRARRRAYGDLRSSPR